MIAGDAAHLMPPFAGQGLGAGVRDVMNLAWKLDAVLSGTASDTLLDTYGPERTAHVSAFIDFSMTLGKVICITDPDKAAQRDERMKADRAAGQQPPAPPRPGLGRGVHTGRAGGSLARQGRVRLPGTAPALFDDAFDGPGALNCPIRDRPGRRARVGAAFARRPAHRPGRVVGAGHTYGVTVVADLDRTPTKLRLDELRRGRRPRPPPISISSSAPAATPRIWRSASSTEFGAQRGGADAGLNVGPSSRRSAHRPFSLPRTTCCVSSTTFVAQVGATAHGRG